MKQPTSAATATRAGASPASAGQASSSSPSPRQAGTLTIGLFAGMAEAIGSREVEIAWTGGTAAALRRRLAEEYPAVAALVTHSAVAIGAAYVTDDAPIPVAAAVAIIPPVSGG